MSKRQPLGYGYGDQIGTGSGWHRDVQAVHPICPLQSTSKHAGSTQATFGFMAPYFRALPDQLSWPRNHMRPLSQSQHPFQQLHHSGVNSALLPAWPQGSHHQRIIEWSSNHHWTIITKHSHELGSPSGLKTSTMGPMVRSSQAKTTCSNICVLLCNVSLKKNGMVIRCNQ